MRPKKTRWINCLPGERCFKPVCRTLSKIESVYLTLDEFEAVRLADLEGLKQVDAAKRRLGFKFARLYFYIRHRSN
jgi:predicted DNA-binding protein (UPF0251 family)